MRNIVLTALSLMVLTLFTSCDSFVSEVDNPIDSISDDQLNDESQVPFAINGVLTRFATTHDQAVLLSDGLSDQTIFDQRVPNATFPTYAQIDIGDITFDNNSVDALFADLGELRFFADKLVQRVTEIEMTDSALRNTALYTGHFMGGVARYFYGAYFGLQPTQGGGVINAGPFIPQAQIWALAIADFDSALAFVDAGSYEAKVVNSAIGRIHVYQGNYDQARTFLDKGLKQGDAAFVSQHSTESPNAYFFGGGRGRTQWALDFRFPAYVDANPAEANRLPMFAVQGNDSPSTTFYIQDKYPERGSPLVFVGWEEVSLMLAELDLRAGNAGAALTRVNTVRASHGLAPLASIDMNGLIVERDKELWLTGNRLIDERRFNIWHLGAGAWQYLPITERERNANDNF